MQWQPPPQSFALPCWLGRGNLMEHPCCPLTACRCSCCSRRQPHQSLCWCVSCGPEQKVRWDKKSGKTKSPVRQKVWWDKITHFSYIEFHWGWLSCSLPTLLGLYLSIDSLWSGSSCSTSEVSATKGVDDCPRPEDSLKFEDMLQTGISVDSHQKYTWQFLVPPGIVMLIIRGSIKYTAPIGRLDFKLVY